MLQRLPVGIFILIAGLVPGCCNCPGDRMPTGPLPEPISLDEQVALLNARIQALPRLRAKTVGNGIELSAPDKDGHIQTQNVEGILQLRQTATGAADVRISGKSMEQTVLDAGRNSSVWWVTLYVNEKTARVGDSRKPVDWSRLQSSDGNIPRPDLIQEMLGLRPLGGANAPAAQSPAEYLTMSVDDSPGINEIMVATPVSPAAGSSQLALTRKILIDRRTGDIKEIRLFDPRGIIVVRSQLTDYRPVTYTGKNNDATQNTPPRFPYHVRIDYPATRWTVSLKFETVAVPDKIREEAFETPEFEAEGVHVVPID